ncbi:MAG TPA: dockerin type I repeat-containing protein, partial [Tepidisphaeraceae bacterium]|nr:dockerin type I repeat-containing protein [Tepidisphaeraceae bacterium]
FTPPPPQWNLDADGSWADPANWSANTVPDGPTAVVNFLGKITAPRTITLDGNRTVATLSFDGSQKYTIAPGTGGTLTIGAAGGTGGINVNPHVHEISAPLVIAAPTTVNVAGDGKLILSGGLDINGVSVLMTGGGDLELSGPQAHQPGATLRVSTTRLILNSNAGSPATPSTAAVANLSVVVNGESGINPSLITLNSSQDLAAFNLTFTDDGPQAVDLNSSPTEFHALRIHLGDLDASKAALSAAIKNGIIIGDDGLIDSGLHPSSAIGIATLTDAHGDPYLLIRPTRIGDLNLDGSVTISDFIDLASHFNGTGGWQEGDLNGDGQVTISDFIDLASNFNASYAGGGISISTSDQFALDSFAAAHGISLVPEPTPLAFLFLAGALLSRRRRHSQRRLHARLIGEDPYFAPNAPAACSKLG